MYEKTPEQLQAMREGGKIIATIFRDLRTRAVAGITERELDQWVEQEIRSYGAVPTYKTSEVNFPASICISTNSQVVHSIPTNYVLQKGDVVGFDLVITYNGMKTDSAFTIVVDEVPSGDKKRLIDSTEQSLYAGINAISGPVKTGDISAAIGAVLKAGGLGIVRELVGHGIGHSMHEPPDIPNFGHAGTGMLLPVGSTIAIEPMATLGKEKIYVGEDHWTIYTADNSLAAHFEHTVLITEDGFEILTAL